MMNGYRVFFDNASGIEHVRRQVLFWLQWSIALREKREYVDAEKKLDQAYREAEMYESNRKTNYDRRQLDDVRAKMIVARAMDRSHDSAELYREIRAASDVVWRLIKLEDLTHHPFETLSGLIDLFAAKNHQIIGPLRSEVLRLVSGILDLAGQRVGVVPPGYQSSKAAAALGRSKEQLLTISNR